MKFDAPLRELPLAEAAQEGRRLEGLGFDGVWTPEGARDAFLPLLPVALATERMNVGTSVAIAFARSPFSMAQIAWDLQRASRGRFMLGLGTQVKAHIERRFSMPFEHPAARVTEYIDCVRAIWDTFQSGAKPDFQGRFYRFQLINDFFNPGPIEHPHIPVLLAGVNPRMARAAGEAADGFSVHPLHSPAYLREVLRPAIEEGARRRGRSVEQMVVTADTFVVRGETEAERSRAAEAVRRQISFYASTPSYRTFLDFHGHEGVGKKLSALMRAGEIEEMPKLVSDELLAEVAICEADGDLAESIRRRYAGLVERIALYEPVGKQDEAEWKALIRKMRAA